MTHSPLPWTKKSEFTNHWFLRDANGETIVLIAQTKQVPEPHPEPGMTLTRTVEMPHAAGNAALFFASPKLLEACHKALAFIDALSLEIGEDDDNYADTVALKDELLAAVLEAEAA